MPVMAGMRINTKSDKTKIARGGVMEFLLANHPLDCPICDQGGECDLQDISEVYGYRQSRYNEYKRSVEDKNFGPLVKTTMTRCIHCTRCVRFSEEVAGDFNLGTTGRGRDTEISTYIENLLTSELSANVVDLCPVGALTNMPYAFKARPWELKSQYTIDTFEPILPITQIDTRGAEVMRILPRVHEEVNEEWISDKSRFAFDGIKRQRLNVPMYKNEKGEYIDLEWDSILNKTAQAIGSINPKDIAVMIGDQADLESITALRDMMHRLGVEDLEFKSVRVLFI
jgi:NADH dehydrogenase (ubiquinone) Fe-S protein 1